MTAALDVCTDEGLRQALLEIRDARSWDVPVGQALLAEIRRRAPRTAAHIAARTGVPNDRTLIDDVVASVWLVAVDHHYKVINAERRWAYLMQSAQRQALDEVRAQQLLTSPTRVRGASRATLPNVLVRVGSTAHDLAVAFRHEPSGPSSDTAAIQAPGRRAPDGLITAPPAAIDGTRHGCHGRLMALLVEHGANRAVTGAAFDRLVDVMTSNRPSYWECAARHDRILQAIGLSLKRASALVALLAGSRRERRNDRRCGLVHQLRATNDAHTVALTASQLQRISTYVGARALSAPPSTELAVDTP